MIVADCWTCAADESKRLESEGKWLESLCFIMYICPKCGSKRCPAATDHTDACTRAQS